MYIGEKEIKSVNNELVTFTDDTTMELSEGYIKYLSSEEPKQTDELYIMKILKIQSDILKIFIDASATKDEISHTIAGVTADVGRHEKNILCNLTGANNYHDINFRKINEIALKIDDKNFTN